MGKIIIFLLLFLLENLISQETPCKPDCLNDEYNPPYPQLALALPITLSECGNAQIVVRYRERRACNLWVDCYIESIEWMGVDGYEECINSFADLSDYIETVTKEFFLFRYPANPFYVWRIMDGACWEADYEKKAIKPCNNINIICCLEEYLIWFDGFSRKCEKTPRIYIEGQCDPNQERCIPICGSVYGR